MSCHGADRWVRTARYSGCSKKPWRGGILAQAVGGSRARCRASSSDGEGAHAMEGRGFRLMVPVAAPAARRASWYWRI